ncbi:MAG: hypothetical protein P4L50_19495 [Anaerolineaceae bacterium]|nr:hypothetical protein [Anaerolineaceae bacterium]
MQTLADLLNSSDGVSFLESKGVFMDPKKFKDQLAAPSRPDLADHFGVKDKKLICSGQQIYVDYHQSVLSKIESLQKMEPDKDLFPFFLWVDTDRSGSDNLISKFAWPSPSKKGAITILPPGTDEVEARFARIDPSRLSTAMARLETHLRQSNQKVDGAKDKYLQMRAFFDKDHADTLSGFNLRLTDFLLTQVLGFSPQSIVLSDQLDKTYILDAVNLFLNHVGEIVQVFNEARQTLIQEGVDPQVRSLEDDYLPLFFSCQADGRRIRLHHAIDGNEHYAVGLCKCGQEYKFHLGEQTISVAEIAQTNRWSPDVCFPIFFNDLVSGYVAGKSSAIYLIILDAVLWKVLKKKPVPILVPESLRINDSEATQVDSLIYRYLSGS